VPRPKDGYRNKAGDIIPGCTTVIGRFKDSGGLLQWAFSQGKSGARSLYEKRDQAADIGTHAHALFEAYRKHQPEPPTPPGFTPEQKAKAETAYLNALEWEQQVKVKSIAVEQSLICECYQYGCTIDEIVEINGKLLDYEWKTSNRVYPDFLVQAAAQRHIWECNSPELKLSGCGIVRFSKDHGDFAYHFFDNLDDAFRQFVLYREAYEIDRSLKRRAA
jgi:hypothetical protein